MPMTPTPISWPWRILIILAVAMLVLVVSAVLYDRSRKPAVQFTAADADPGPVLACPGDIVPIRYRIQIGQVPTDARRKETWRSELARETVLTGQEQILELNLADPVDRVIEQAIVVPDSYSVRRDGVDTTLQVQPGEVLTYQRGVTALISTGVYRYSLYERSVQIKEDCP